ncbi:MAG TPA: hypothetical protein DDX39_04410 [Bacteroidales bacterium]|nr:MAG: hypothetical protein A2W98_10590 [Bacteroidetes bacterium GWF2_33_38]OFY75485.1 MAG: hypothetical protein A2265_03355 [Bacteroidetes bacterium RIFOXYA12_FULL_33_9]OFY90526.1 MAG: hypothetical protein A2236_05565 [Bacteroidetes bacterium RIFOXYA2_FULL_33_7]HBF87866.1 hypothetical protein [Bacteroidales bacterium]
MLKKIAKIGIVLLALSVIIPTGCKDKDQLPPDLPPDGSFVMDFSDFASSNKSALNITDSTDTTYGNFAYSVINVGVWNAIITVGLAVPVAAFVESFNHEPELNDDDWWVWSYSFDVWAATYTAELHGKVENNKVNWEMYISKTGFGAFTDFLWFKGESDVDNTSGEWTLYNKPTDASELLEITWEAASDGSAANIKYMNIVPDGPENGGYIQYGKTTDVNYDAFYDIYNKGLENYTKITWNRNTKAGKVQDSNFFADEDWHCWDTAFIDVECE